MQHSATDVALALMRPDAFALPPDRRSPEVVAAFQQRLASRGRGGDTRIAHLTPGEGIIPRSIMQDPAMVKRLNRFASLTNL